MIKVDDFKQWNQDDINDTNFFMIVVGYNPKNKDYYIDNNGFGLECEIEDRDLFVNILTDEINAVIGNKFIVKLENSKFSWFPDWLINEYTNIDYIKNYLDSINWKQNSYIGDFEIDNIKEFLNVFIDYPQKFKYQDIELYSKITDFLCVISRHGTFWFVAKNIVELRKIAKRLDDKDVLVFPRKYLS